MKNSKYKIAFLAAASSIHTVKWANVFVQNGYNVVLFSMHTVHPLLDKRVHLVTLPFPAPYGYILNCFYLRLSLLRERPDVLQVHYVSGYGLLAYLTKFHPAIHVPWGSDLYLFPKLSRIHHWIIKKILSSSDQIVSVCRDLQVNSKSYAPFVPNEVICFGVDLDKFSPICSPPRKEVVIGTVKTLESVYGIDILIKAFAKAKEMNRHLDLFMNLQLLIVGGGTKLSEYKRLCQELGIQDSVQFAGAVSHDDVPIWLNRLDVYVAASRSESFGVAVAEASACGIPAIVSNVGGLPDTVEDGKTGLVCPSEDIVAFAKAISLLANDCKTRQTMGENARKKALIDFSWENSFQKMEKIVRRVCE